MDKYPKTDSEFEALFELAYKRKIGTSQFHGLQKQVIVDKMRAKQDSRTFQKKGFENASAKTSLKTRLYLGTTAGGRKVFFNVDFKRTGITCSSTMDLSEIGKNLDSFQFDQDGGRAKNYAGELPKRRLGKSNLTKIDLAYLLAFQHICEFKKVGHVGNTPSRELTRELMYLVKPAVESDNERSSYYAITWMSVLEAWELPYATDYHNFKRYFNSLVNTELKEMEQASVQHLKREEKAS